MTAGSEDFVREAPISSALRPQESTQLRRSVLSRPSQLPLGQSKPPRAHPEPPATRVTLEIA